VDLVCDAALVLYYERLGMRGASSALLRHRPRCRALLRPVPDPSLATVLGWDDENRAVRVLHDLATDRPHQEPSESASAARA
jgi:hypothetical protein